MIKDDVVLGKDVKIYQPDLVNLYGCTIGDETSIGAFVEIRKGVVIGARVKIQAFCIIPEGVIIEDEVFLGPHIAFTNDRFPRAVNPDGSRMSETDWQLEKTLVKRRASIGGGVTIVGGITIGEGSMIAAGAVVTRDVPDHTLVAGVPARVVRRIDE